jgi:hypothetical protein
MKNIRLENTLPLIIEGIPGNYFSTQNHAQTQYKHGKISTQVCYYHTGVKCFFTTLERRGEINQTFSEKTFFTQFIEANTMQHNRHQGGLSVARPITKSN